MPNLHGLAGVGHALHVAVDLVEALLDRLEGGEEVAVDLQVPPLNLTPQVAPHLQVVLLDRILYTMSSWAVSKNWRN